MCQVEPGVTLDGDIVVQLQLVREDNASAATVLFRYAMHTAFWARRAWTTSTAYMIAPSNCGVRFALAGRGLRGRPCPRYARRGRCWHCATPRSALHIYESLLVWMTLPKYEFLPMPLPIYEFLPMPLPISAHSRQKKAFFTRARLRQHRDLPRGLAGRGCGRGRVGAGRAGAVRSHCRFRNGATDSLS